MPCLADVSLRARINILLSGDALTSPWTQRALTQPSFNGIARRLQALAPNDLVGKLVVGGLTLVPYQPIGDEDRIEHSCATCLYYERHRRFYNLPELMLPVDPQWSCIVWRI